MTKVLLFSALLFVNSLRYTTCNDLDNIAASNAKFSRDFFKSLNNVPGNLVSSPLSAHLVLSMTQLGARGQTASEMSSALHLPADANKSNAGFKQLSDTLQGINSSKVNLKMANRIYVKSRYNVKQEFLAAVRNAFNSETQSVDFANLNTQNIINQWVEQNTEGKIKNLVQKDVLRSSTRLVLVNAVYFNGKWGNVFNALNTQSKSFYTSATNSVSVPMMFISKYFKYLDSNVINAKVLNIPFADNTMNFVIVLPNSRTGLSEVERKMQNADLSALINSAVSTDIELTLPKFKIESKIELEEALTKMGMGRIFGASADFSGITNTENLQISQVFQQATIEVNEKGTEAAAATYVLPSVRTSVEHIIPPTVYTVDHPFLFYLVHKTTANNHVVLFSGRVVQPRGFEDFDPANIQYGFYSE